MCDDSLRHVYKVVILSKLLRASSAWWGSTSAADKQRLEASLRRAVRSGLYSVDDPSFSQLVEDMADNLFAIHIMFCTNFYLRKLIALTISDHGVILSHYLSRLIVEIT